MNKSAIIITASEKLANSLRHDRELISTLMAGNGGEIFSMNFWASYCYRNILFGSKRIITLQERNSVLRHIAQQLQPDSSWYKHNAWIKEFLIFWRDFHNTVQDDSALSLVYGQDTNIELYFAYIEFLSTNQLIDPNCLPAEINKLLTTYASQLQLPSLIFFGFHKLTAMEKSHISHLAMHTTCQFYYPVFQQADITTMVATTLNDEKQQIAQLINTFPEHKSITILALQPEKIDEWYEALLTLCPKYRNEISAQKIIPLARFQVIKKALSFLSLLIDYNEQLPLASLIEFLAEPTLSINIDPSWLQELSNLPFHLITINEFNDYMLRTQTSDQARWWQNIFEHFQQPPALQAKNEWHAFFLHGLELLGWPFLNQINSENYQLLQAWQKHLSSWAFSDQLAPQPITFAEAFIDLSFMLENTNFQAKENQTTRIQIVTPNQYQGHTTDCLLVTEMTMDHYPFQDSLHPAFENWHECNSTVPYAHPSQLLLRTQHQIQSWSSSAQAIVYSYSENQGETLNQHAPILDHFKQHPQQPSTASTTKNKYIEDNFYQSVTKKSYSKLLNSRALKHQAECSMKALWLNHLNLIDYQPSDQSAIKRLRGIVVHEVLAKFWSQIKNSTALFEMTSAQLCSLVSPLIDQALKKSFLQNSWLSSTINRQLEHQLIESMILNYLELEKTRESFTVTHTEHEDLITINNHPIKVRYDRIDKTKSGHILVDYKTGAAHPRDWLGERPIEPQMPLYLLSKTFDFLSLDYGLVHGKKPGYICGRTYIEKALSSEKSAADEPWMTFKIKTAQELSDLIEQFINKPASHDPKDTFSTCVECEFNQLCRITEIKEVYEHSDS